MSKTYIYLPIIKLLQQTRIASAVYYQQAVLWFVSLCSFPHNNNVLKHDLTQLCSYKEIVFKSLIVVEFCKTILYNFKLSINSMETVKKRLFLMQQTG